MTLSSLGWDAAFAASFPSFSAAGLVPARVAAQHRNAYDLLTTHGPLFAECTGKLRQAAIAPAELPAVGDWVAARLRPGEAHADIHAVLPRKTKFSRRAAGDHAVNRLAGADRQRTHAMRRCRRQGPARLRLKPDEE